MKIWLITSISIRPDALPRASSLQNLRTAEALALAGHEVLIWIVDRGVEPREWFEGILGRTAPAELQFIAYEPHGPRHEKKTPFDSAFQRWKNLRAARGTGVWPPELVLTRSPRIVRQLKGSWLSPRGAHVVLEWQYPEAMQLWRAWWKGARLRIAHGERLRAGIDQLRHWTQLEQHGVREADGVLYAARAHERVLAASKYAGPVCLLSSGCEPPDPIEEIEAAQPEFDFGYIGGLAPENGIEVMLEALAELPETRMLLVGAGRGAYVEQLKRTAHAIGLDDRIEFAGWVWPREARATMRRCRIGLVPLSRRQGPEKRQFASPLKLIEWLAAGVPVIASAVPSITGRIANGQGALLVPPDDPKALAEAMRELHGNPALQDRLRATGLALASESTFTRRAKAIIDFVALVQRNRR